MHIFSAGNYNTEKTFYKLLLLRTISYKDRNHRQERKLLAHITSKPRAKSFFKNTWVRGLRRSYWFIFPPLHSILLFIFSFIIRQLSLQNKQLCPWQIQSTYGQILPSSLFFARTPMLSSHGFKLSYTCIPGPTKVTILCQI